MITEKMKFIDLCDQHKVDCFKRKNTEEIFDFGIT